MAIASEHLEGKTMQYLAQKYKVNVGTIQYTLTQNKAIRKLRNSIDGNRERIIKDYQSGVSLRQLTKKYKHGEQNIIDVIAQTGYVLRTNTESKRIHKLDESFFDRIDTQEKAYFLGILYADGCNNGQEVTLGLQAADKDILHKLKGVIQSEAPIRTRINKGYSSGKSSAILNLCSKRLCNRLTELGCTNRKSFTLTFPDFLPEDLISHFLRGYLDGDGWICVNRSRVLVGLIGSEAFIKTALEVIESKCNVRAYYRESKTKGIAQLEIRGGNRVRSVLNYLYSGATISLKRKKEKADIILSLSNLTNPLLSSDTIHSIERELAASIPVKQIAQQHNVSTGSVYRILKRGI